MSDQQVIFDVVVTSIEPHASKFLSILTFDAIETNGKIYDKVSTLKSRNICIGDTIQVKFIVIDVAQVTCMYWEHSWDAANIRRSARNKVISNLINEIESAPYAANGNMLIDNSHWDKLKSLLNC